jgi:ribosome recycling factor
MTRRRKHVRYLSGPEREAETLRQNIRNARRHAFLRVTDADQDSHADALERRLADLLEKSEPARGSDA